MAPQQPTNICQMSIVDSSTSPATHQLLYFPISLSCQLLMSSMPRVTLTVVIHVTPGLVHLSAHTCALSPTMCRLKELPCVIFRSFHISLYGPYGLYSQHATCHCTNCTDCTVIPFFTCLPFWTERDILHIRSPFDEVNIPSESGRRDRCNGASFIAFQALSFLSIFKPYQASGSDFGSHLPTKRPFGPQKVTDHSISSG
jgi:hypothetical protein